ncbi:hypothetical protein FOA52_014672 [Chlamydomonas sp. UWO 241]|nr:hypothetical protein FOA52_014672 [Chlamydomonas sp. UWO 241]
MRILASIGAPSVACSSTRVRSAVPALRVSSRQPQGLRQQQLSGVAERRDVRVSFFKFGGEVAPSDADSQQKREDYFAADVEDYFNYMGCLADEGTYDRMYSVSEGRDPIDTLLLLAAVENDTPKIGEILKAGANPNVVGPDGKTPVELAKKQDTIDLIQSYLDKQAVKA